MGHAFRNCVIGFLVDGPCTSVTLKAVRPIVTDFTQQQSHLQGRLKPSEI